MDIWFKGHLCEFACSSFKTNIIFTTRGQGSAAVSPVLALSTRQLELTPLCITLSYLIIYYTSSSIIHTGTISAIQRSIYTTIPVYIQCYTLNFLKHIMHHKHTRVLCSGYVALISLFCYMEKERKGHWVIKYKLGHKHLLMSRISLLTGLTMTHLSYIV